jgi:hypothetical protein
LERGKSLEEVRNSEDKGLKELMGRVKEEIEGGLKGIGQGK